MVKKYFSMAILATVLVAALELYTPLGFAHGFWYVPILLLVAKAGSITFLRVMSAACVILVIAGYWVSPPAPPLFPDHFVLLNRLASILALMMTYWASALREAYTEIESISEKQVNEAKQKFIELADNMPLVVWTADNQGNVDYVSKPLEVITGKSRSVIISDWLGLLHPEDRERATDKWAEAISNGTTYTVEFRIQNNEGEYLWYLTEAKPVKDHSGNIVKWYGSGIDMSVIKQVQQEKEFLHQRLTNFLASITDAFFMLDREFRFTYVNEVAANILNEKPDKLLGSIIWEKAGVTHNSAFSKQYRRILSSGEPDSFTEYYLPTNKWLNVSVYPSEEGLVVYVKDITEQYKTEEELKLLRVAISRLNDIILITDAEPIDEPGPKTVFVNEAFERRTGYSKDEILGQTPRILQGPKTQREELDRIRHALKNWSPVRAQLINYTKTGEEFWLELDIVPLANKDGLFTHWVAVERDITDQKRLQKQLSRSQRMESLGKLTGGIAHDFNNLLTVMIGNTEILDELLEDQPNLQQIAKLTLKAALRGEKLTNSLLAFSRQQHLDSKVVDVNLLLTELEELLTPSIGERHALITNLGNKIERALIDPSQLENSLINLIMNARDAMPEGGNIIIESFSVYFDQDYVSRNKEVSIGHYIGIAITDSGTGIDPRIIDHIYEPFFTTKEQDKGTGLGLATAFGFIKQSKGHISVYSERGIGTTFKLYVPAYNCQHNHFTNQKESEVSTVPKVIDEKKTILIVEDNQEVMSIAKTILAAAGYRTITASNGTEAKRILMSDKHLDLLFSDVVMPGEMDGMQLAEFCRQTRPQLPILLTSGFTEKAVCADSTLPDNITLLPKPYQRNSLLSAVYQQIWENMDSISTR